MTAAHADVSRDVETRVNVAELNAWTAANEKARRSYWATLSARTWAQYKAVR